MTDIQRHPILLAIYDVMQAIERCGASPELTDAIVLAVRLNKQAATILDELDVARAELDRVREALQPARDALAAIDSSTDEARQRTGRMAEDACFYAAQRALMALDAARASGSNDLRHVCGERGYNRMIDPACPACEQSRHNAARKETSHD